MDQKSGILVTCLFAVVVSMLATGLFAGAAVRYAVQAIPASVLLVAVIARRPWVTHAAIGVFLVCGAITLSSWARVFRGVDIGHPSAQIAALSGVLGTACLIGCIAAGWDEPRSLWGRLVVFSVWAVAQGVAQMQALV